MSYKSKPQGQTPPDHSYSLMDALEDAIDTAYLRKQCLWPL